MRKKAVAITHGDSTDGFKLTHLSATLEKALVAADNIERLVGQVMNGDTNASGRFSSEDLAILVQFVRNVKIPTLQGALKEGDAVHVAYSEAGAPNWTRYTGPAVFIRYLPLSELEDDDVPMVEVKMPLGNLVWFPTICVTKAP